MTTKPHSIKMSQETEDAISELRITPKHKRNFSQMVVYLIETNHEFMAHIDQKNTTKNRTKKNGKFHLGNHAQKQCSSANVFYFRR